MLHELWQAGCPDHFLGEPVPGTGHPLREEPFLQSLPTEVPSNPEHSVILWFMAHCPSPDAAAFPFLVSCCWSPERGDQQLPLRCPLWGSCRLRWGHSLQLVSYPSIAGQTAPYLILFPPEFLTSLFGSSYLHFNDPLIRFFIFFSALLVFR